MSKEKTEKRVEQGETAGQAVVPPSPSRKLPVDRLGEAWSKEANRRWVEGGQTIDGYVPVPLPEWTASSAVSRELLGQFIHNRDDNVVHDVREATEDCDVDGIRNATFIHFAYELETALPTEAIFCPTCMKGE